MHFGNLIYGRLVMMLLVASSLYSCKRERKPLNFVSPIEGAVVVSGTEIHLKTDAELGSFDSVRYYLDAKLLKTRKDTLSVAVQTKGLPFGGRLITAVVFTGKDSSELTTNIQLLPAQAPQRYSYEVVNTFPHDTSSYTQGLEYHDGVFYESDGLNGESSLRKVAVNSGKVLQKVDIPAQYFAEGITVIGDRIVMLTYQNGVGFVFDKASFKKLSEFPYTAGREGWGLAYNGKHILNSDGTNTIHLLNPNTFQKEGAIEVYDANGAVDSLNELEYINGKIYANIYQKDRVVIINPVTGGVEADLDLSALDPYADRLETNLVLNGIAWDAKGKRLFVTGKKWNKLYEIRIKQGK